MAGPSPRELLLLSAQTQAYVREWREAVRRDDFWHRKSEQVVLAIAMVRDPIQKTTKTIRYPKEDLESKRGMAGNRGNSSLDTSPLEEQSVEYDGYLYCRGMNTEVSLPAGSLCAERVAICSCVSNRPMLFRADFVAIAVVDPTDTRNPIETCGVCAEYIRKSQEAAPRFQVITFTSAACDQIVRRFQETYAHSPTLTSSFPSPSFSPLYPSDLRRGGCVTGVVRSRSSCSGRSRGGADQDEICPQTLSVQRESLSAPAPTLLGWFPGYSKHLALLATILMAAVWLVVQIFYSIYKS